MLDFVKRLFSRRPSRPRTLPPGPEHKGPMIRASGRAMSRLAYSEMKLRPQTILPGSYSTRPFWPTWNAETAFSEGWKGSSWVYICTMKTARALASVPWLAHKRAGRRLKPWPEHPIQRLLDRPNPFWSQRDLILRIGIELGIVGNSVISKVRIDPTSPPAQIFTNRPQLVAPIPSNDVHVAGFSIAALDGRRYFLGAHDAVHIQLPDPTSPYWGMSPLQAGSRPVDLDRRAGDWQANAIDNGLIPPGAFIINEGEGMTDAEFEQAQEQLAEEYQGAENARRPLLLSNVRWQQLSVAPSDVDFIKTRHMTKKEIGLLYDVPLALLGEQNTFNNMHEAREAHWNDGVLPLAWLISDALTIQLASEWNDDVVIAPDTSRVPALVNARSKQISSVKDLWTMGAPFNDAAEYMGLDFEIPGGDVGYVPTNLLPSTTEGAVDTVDMIGVEQPPNETGWKRLPRRKHKTNVTDFRRWLESSIEDAEIVEEAAQ